MLKGNLGRLPGGSEVLLAFWDVNAGGKEQQGETESLTGVAGVQGKESLYSGTERSGSTVL